MAKLNALGGNRASGSVGTTTFAVVDGQLIARAKRGPSEKSKLAAKGANGQGDSVRNGLFRCIITYYNGHKTAINESFTKAQRRSALNTFMSVNYEAFKIAWKQTIAGLYNGGLKVPLLSQLETELTTYVTADTYNTAGYPPVYRAYRFGFEPEILTAAWNDDLTLQACGRIQGVLSVCPSTGDEFTVTPSQYVDIFGTNITALSFGYAAGRVSNPLYVSSTDKLRVDWDTLVAAGCLTDEQIAAGTVTYQWIESAYSEIGNDVLWGTVIPT